MYGDSRAARKRVAALREQADDVRAMADRLVSQAESIPWSGRAADAMRARIKERAQTLRVAAEHHETAADSLARHIREVDTLKESIAVTERKAAALTTDATNRVAALGPGAEPEPEDSTLVSFVPPPSGHKDWLLVELPGL